MLPLALGKPRPLGGHFNSFVVSVTAQVVSGAVCLCLGHIGAEICPPWPLTSLHPGVDQGRGSIPWTSGKFVLCHLR